MPNRGLAWKGPSGWKATTTGTLQPKGPGWQLDPAGNGTGRGMIIQGRKPRTEFGLQAIRASSCTVTARSAAYCYPRKPIFRQTGRQNLDANADEQAIVADETNAKAAREATHGSGAM